LVQVWQFLVLKSPADYHAITLGFTLKSYIPDETIFAFAKKLMRLVLNSIIFISSGSVNLYYLTDSEISCNKAFNFITRFFIIQACPYLAVCNK